MVILAIPWCKFGVTLLPLTPLLPNTLQSSADTKLIADILLQQYRFECHTAAWKIFLEAKAQYTFILGRDVIVPLPYPIPIQNTTQIYIHQIVRQKSCISSAITFHQYIIPKPHVIYDSLHKGCYYLM